MTSPIRDSICAVTTITIPPSAAIPDLPSYYQPLCSDTRNYTCIRPTNPHDEDAPHPLTQSPQTIQTHLLLTFPFQILKNSFQHQRTTAAAIF